MNKLALAAATLAVGAAAISTAHAGSELNGPKVTGIAFPALATSHPAVTTVTLPSGETVDLSSQSNR